MFATFTDWEFADMDAMVSTGNAMWPKVQAAGAGSLDDFEKTVRFVT